MPVLAERSRAFRPEDWSRAEREADLRNLVQACCSDQPQGHSRLTDSHKHIRQEPDAGTARLGRLGRGVTGWLTPCDMAQRHEQCSATSPYGGILVSRAAGQPRSRQSLLAFQLRHSSSSSFRVCLSAERRELCTNCCHKKLAAAPSAVMGTGGCRFGSGDRQVPQNVWPFWARERLNCFLSRAVRAPRRDTSHRGRWSMGEARAPVRLPRARVLVIHAEEMAGRPTMPTRRSKATARKPCIPTTSRRRSHPPRRIEGVRAASEIGRPNRLARRVAKSWKKRRY